MTIPLVFFIVNVLYGAQMNENLSGQLASYTVLTGDQGSFHLTGKATAVLHSIDRYTFEVKGGQAELLGQGKTIDIDQDNCGGLFSPCADSRFYFLFVTGPSKFTVNDCTFNVLNSYVSVAHALDTQEILMASCKLTGTPFMFLRANRTGQLSVTDCTFEDLKEDNAIPYPFLGFILTLQACGEFHLTDCTFKNIDAGTYSSSLVGGNVGGYSAPVYIEDSRQVTISGCSFENCSGFLAGAIFSYLTDSMNTYSDLEFKDDVSTLPVDKIMTLLGLGGITDLFGSSPTLGNDITRIGLEPITTRSICSNSAKPHYRNGLSEENFDACKFQMPGWGVALIVLGAVALVAAALIVLCCCCCRCCCCYASCRGCCRKSPDVNKKDESVVGVQEPAPQQVCAPPANAVPLQPYYPAQNYPQQPLQSYPPQYPPQPQQTAYPPYPPQYPPQPQQEYLTPQQHYPAPQASSTSTPPLAQAQDSGAPQPSSLSTQTQQSTTSTEPQLSTEPQAYPPLPNLPEEETERADGI